MCTVLLVTQCGNLQNRLKQSNRKKLHELRLKHTKRSGNVEGSKLALFDVRVFV